MKKFLLILCACAILLSGTACKKKSDEKKDTKDTEEVVERETVDLDGDGISDGYIIEGETGFDSGEAVEPDNGEGNQGSSTPTSEIQEPEVVAEGGTEPGLWPTESVPEDVPEFNEYTEMYDVTHTDSESAEEWYMSFDSTEEGYEAYLDKLRAEGYKESQKIVGFWGNGEQILNLFTEEVDGMFCVSIDIFKSKPVEYPEAVKNIFPEFTVTDSTLYGWYIKEGEPKTLSVSYACGEEFEFNLNAYKNKLAEAGFTVAENQASIEKDGKTYEVRYGDAVNRYEDCLEYVYYE